jgi:pyridoxal phosphate enzyme (YggS family)
MTNPRELASGLSERLTDVRNRVIESARGCGRSPDEIAIIAISKTHPASAIEQALELGLTDFGENRLQEAESKILALGGRGARWHLVGHLQANKARRALKLFDVIHSLDSIELAKRLDRLCVEEGREELQVLIQVDLGKEETKYGISEAGLPELVRSLDHCPKLQLWGLMTLPPFFEDPEKARPFFRKLRELRDEFASQSRFANGTGELSMGMTHDFEIAIEEGATMLRIGTAIFGERLPQL